MKEGTDDKRSIKKISFNGTGNKLIDYICIIGFESHYIEDEITMNYPTNLYYEPTVLTSIISEDVEAVFDENKLIKIIYPKAPRVTNNNIVKDFVSNIIFSFPISSSNNNGTMQNNQCAYSRLFYESYITLKEKKNIKQLFIPKAISIVSQFPYFTTFSIICQRIVSYWQNNSLSDNSIPLEVILHNIVNYIPSPLNSDIYLNVFPKTMNIISKNDDNNDNDMMIHLPQLSGYPIVNFNLNKIFSFFPINFIIEVFIFSMLEVDMFFFSRNLEMLNMMMYVFYLLNYPLNDTMNFWHIFSLSKEDITNEIKPQFINNILNKCIIFLGINSQYEDNIPFPSQFRLYTMVDLENKKVIHKGIDGEKVNEMDLVGKYIQRCIKGKDVKSQFLNELIHKLIESLSSINLNNTMDNMRRSVTVNVSKQADFFEFNKEIEGTNKKIQECFYNFIIYFLKIFYMDYSVSFDPKTTPMNLTNIKKDTKDVNNNEPLYHLEHANHNENNYEIEEKIIVKLFTESTKYDNYFSNYLYDFSTLDSYKIPLLFSEEYINIDLPEMQLNNDNDYSAILFYFDIIDSFYYNNHLNKNSITISFQNYYQHYENELMIITNRIDQKRKLKHHHKVNSIKSEYTIPLTNNLLQLNHKRLIKAMHFSRNLSNDLKAKLFPYYELLQSGIDHIDSIDSLQLTIAVEEGMISANLVETDAIILTSLCTVFSFTTFNVSFDIALCTFNQLISKLIFRHFFTRKYLYKILVIFDCICRKSEKEGVVVGESEKNMYYIHNFYYVLINLIRSTNVFPNEEMKEVMLRLTKDKRITDAPVYDYSINNLIDKDDEIDYDIKAVDQNQKSIDIEMVINAIKNSIAFCKINLDDNEMELKISLSFNKKKKKNHKEEEAIIIDDNKEKIHDYSKLYVLFFPVEIKEKSEELYNAFIQNEGNYGKLMKEHYQNLEDIIVNALYYSTIYNEFKMFTEYFLIIFKYLIK